MKKYKGISACSGKVRGKVLKIDNPIKPVLGKKGYILVAPFTTPVIALAISQAKGIVCEKGGITSHAAIISRELGIPCVVGVTGILAVLKNNQLITVDANKGEIIC